MIFTPDGYVLTNAHVVAGAARLRASFTDGQVLDATLVGEDADTDTAVLRLAGNGLPHAELGRSATLRVGQLVAAIGNPLGFQCTVTAGIVSRARPHAAHAVRAHVESVIQTDAPLNPGNSGGPLVSGRGARGRHQHRDDRAGAGHLLRHRHRHRDLGRDAHHARRAGAAVAAWRCRGRRCRSTRGCGGSISWRRRAACWCWRCQQGGPAARAGVQRGDVIVAFDGAPVAGVDDLHRALTVERAGRAVALTVLRRAEKLEVSVTPGEA